MLIFKQLRAKRFTKKICKLNQHLQVPGYCVIRRSGCIYLNCHSQNLIYPKGYYLKEGSLVITNAGNVPKFKEKSFNVMFPKHKRM